MRRAGRSATYVLGLHLAITIISTIAAIVGYVVSSRLSPEVNAATMVIAAGAILAMLADTVMPEAYEEGHDLVGIITVAGFLAAFVLTELGG